MTRTRHIPMQHNRWRYRDIMSMPVWYLLDADRRMIATVRAPTRENARDLFRSGLPVDDVQRGAWISLRYGRGILKEDAE